MNEQETDPLSYENLMTPNNAFEELDIAIARSISIALDKTIEIIGRHASMEVEEESFSLKDLKEIVPSTSRRGIFLTNLRKEVGIICDILSENGFKDDADNIKRKFTSRKGFLDKTCWADMGQPQFPDRFSVELKVGPNIITLNKEIVSQYCSMAWQDYIGSQDFSDTVCTDNEPLKLLYKAVEDLDIELDLVKDVLKKIHNTAQNLIKDLEVVRENREIVYEQFETGDHKVLLGKLITGLSKIKGAYNDKSNDLWISVSEVGDQDLSLVLSEMDVDFNQELKLAQDSAFEAMKMAYKENPTNVQKIYEKTVQSAPTEIREIARIPDYQGPL